MVVVGGFEVLRGARAALAPGSLQGNSAPCARQASPCGRPTCFLALESAGTVEDLAARGGLCTVLPSSRVRPQIKALPALPCPCWRLLSPGCACALQSSAFLCAEPLQVSLAPGGGAGRCKTCRGTSACPPWRRALWLGEFGAV